MTVSCVAAPTEVRVVVAEERVRDEGIGAATSNGIGGSVMEPFAGMVKKSD